MENSNEPTKKLAYLLIGCLAIIGIACGVFIGNISHPQIDSVLKDSCPTALHHSYFSSKSFYDDGYKNAPTPQIQSASNIKGVIVNHHLLVPNLIAETIGTIATTAPVTVVLISPNHFHTGNGQIISSIYKWETPYGILDSNCSAISDLEKQGVLNVAETPFENEHGVTGIVPFIKKSLPNAEIIPVIIKDTLSEDQLNTFVQHLYATLGNKIILVGSFDFSHYLPDAGAQFHDAKSLSVIKNFDYTGVKAIDNNSMPGLEIVLKYFEKEGAQHFDLIANANSAQVLHDPSIDETTSYIDGAFSIGPKDEDSTATVLAFGDMMLDRAVRQKINKNGAEYPFLSIKRFLIGSDIVVANAEGAFTSYPSETLNASNAPLKFTFDPAILPILKKLGFTLFSEANNHALNFGPEGLKQSEEFIDSAGLNWFGDPLNQNVDPFITTIRGEKIAFIGYHQFATGGFDNVTNSIKSAKQQGAFVIVYPHWGIEYNSNVTQTQIDDAHAFIDAGADVILGSHPHVIEPIEIYKGKAIFYSMGNFVFDQSSKGPTSQGLSVGISITPTKISYFLFPLNIRQQQTSLMSYAERVKLLASLAGESSVSADIKNNIINGIISLNRL